jgi:miniconductance mechanosensitive channel
MILPEEKYPSLQLDPEWLTNVFNVDPQVAFCRISGLIIVCFIAWILTKKLIVETIHKLFLKN